MYYYYYYCVNYHQKSQITRIQVLKSQEKKFTIYTQELKSLESQEHHKKNKSAKKKSENQEIIKE